ncbi:DUF1850 domain-containing protein [Bacillus sp. USDA818B3_A]|uniref:DUF1850 domain-containing protein n=1 Tax=Bacillus sp. USDA818B3_A TaxID=2698834 RepID=UPI001F1A352D|nr:DUF1850 domain-containing protein [Bacillus sp. USDA818B3_A]
MAYVSIVLVICFVSASILLVYLPLKLAIVFQPYQSSTKSAYLPLNDETRFKIKYTHSIHLTDVVESYRITANHEIQQYELSYEDFAIGMPSNAEHGERFVQRNGRYYLKNMNRIFPYFYLRVGQVRANHRVIFKQKVYPLSKSIRPGTAVKVEIRRLTMVELWKGVNILESL